MLQGHLQTLKATTVDISSCETTSKAICSAAGPVDSRVASQKVWLLSHQRDELENQILNLLYRINERKELESRFKTR